MEKFLFRVITENESGMTVGKYLKNELKLTEAQIRSLKFRERGICVNDVRARVTEVLRSGDKLRLMKADADEESSCVEAVKFPLSILYEDEDLICVWKPWGMVVHPSPGHYRDSLSNYLAAYFSEKQERVRIRSIGRLDGDTSGIVVFAKNKVAAQRLWKQREQGIFSKEYLALCEGGFGEKEFEREQKIDAPMDWEKESFRKMQVCPDGKWAVTYYQAVKEYASGGMTLVRLRLESGRTHQIRVHMAHLGHPLVGDPIYGNGISHMTHAHLCAWKVRFCQPFTQKEIVLSARLEDGRNIPSLPIW